MVVSLPGTGAERFAFTVCSGEVARRINGCVGACLAPRCEQHIGIPTTCLGERRCSIAAVKIVQESGFMPREPATMPSTPGSR